MILPDASMWIEHFRHGNDRLAALLDDDQVLMHPFVVGELVCGNLSGRRAEVLAAFAELPQAPVAEHAEVMQMVEQRGLAGTGIGWVDAHLLASSLIAGVLLWTLDLPLQRQARRLGLAPAP